MGAVLDVETYLAAGLESDQALSRGIAVVIVGEVAPFVDGVGGALYPAIGVVFEPGGVEIAAFALGGPSQIVVLLEAGGDTVVRQVARGVVLEAAAPPTSAS